jgi:hypothetical protein
MSSTLYFAYSKLKRYSLGRNIIVKELFSTVSIMSSICNRIVDIYTLYISYIYPISIHYVNYTY